MAAPHGPTRCLRGVHIFINNIHIIYSRGFQLFVDRKGIQSLNPSGLINPTGFNNFSRVGLIHAVSLNASDVASFRALDRDRSAPIKWTRGPRIKIKTTCLLI